MLYSTTASSFQRNSCTRTCFLQTEKHVISIEPCFSTIRETREMKWNTVLSSKMAYFHLFMKECDISKRLLYIYFTKKNKASCWKRKPWGEVPEKKALTTPKPKNLEKTKNTRPRENKNTKQRKLLNKSRKNPDSSESMVPLPRPSVFCIYIIYIYIF